MLQIVVAVIVLLVICAIAFGAVGATVSSLQAQAVPAVLEIDSAVNYIADRLPQQATARLSYADVRSVLLWHLDYFDEAGMSSEYGQELGVKWDGEAEPAIASEEDSVGYCVGRAIEDGREIDDVDIALVLGLHMQYLQELGAIGADAHDFEEPL